MNMLNARLDYQEFGVKFANTFIKPFTKQMKSREDVVEVHYLITNNLKNEIEQLSLKIAELEYNIEFPSKYTMNATDSGSDEEERFQQEIEQFQKDKEECQRKKTECLQHLRLLKITALVSEEQELSWEAAQKKRFLVLKEKLNKKSLEDREEELRLKKINQAKICDRIQGFQKQYTALEILNKKYAEYRDNKSDLMELEDKRISTIEQCFSSQKGYIRNASVAKFVSKLALNKEIAVPDQEELQLESLFKSIEKEIFLQFERSRSVPINIFLGSKTKKVKREIKKFVTEQNKLITDFIKNRIQKLFEETLAERKMERENQKAMKIDIAFINRLDSKLKAVMAELNEEHLTEINSFPRMSIFESSCFKEVLDYEAVFRRGMKKWALGEEPVRRKKSIQQEEEEKKDFMMEDRLESIVEQVEKFEETKKDIEACPEKHEEEVKKESANIYNLTCKELEQLKRLNLLKLKLQVVQTSLQLLEKANREHCIKFRKIADCFKPAARVHLSILKRNIFNFNAWREASNRDVVRIEQEINRIRLYQAEESAHIELENLIKSVATNEEGHQKLRDYAAIYKRTLENYCRTAGMLEAEFERNTGQEITEFTIDKLEILLSSVPFGKYVSNALKNAKWDSEYKKELIPENGSQAFSSLILNSKKLGYILENSALQLIRQKKDLILGLEEKVHESAVDTIQKESKTAFAKSDKLTKRLNTGSKTMAAIDVALTITNVYLNFLSKPQSEVGLDDVYGMKKTIEFFVECGQQFDELKYLDLLKEGRIQLQQSKKN